MADPASVYLYLDRFFSSRSWVLHESFRPEGSSRLSDGLTASRLRRAPSLPSEPPVCLDGGGLPSFLYIRDTVFIQPVASTFSFFFALRLPLP